MGTMDDRGGTWFRNVATGKLLDNNRDGDIYTLKLNSGVY